MTVTVTAPPAAAPPHSLLRAAITNRDDDAGGEWVRGLQYVSETCGGYRALSDCTAEELDQGAAAGVADAVVYRPWDLQVQDPCPTTFGYQEAEVTARLRRAADSIESYAIARELWTGELSEQEAAAIGGGAEPNLYLAKDPTVLGSGPVSPRRGLGLLQKAAGDAFHGQQVFLHIARDAITMFGPDLAKVGNLLYTNLDNVVVADAGYPGTPPEGTSAAANVSWMYATGPVVVRRSPLVLDSANDAEVIDTRTNTIRRTAGKRVAATFDTCAYFAVPITLS
jgi:hypothetical protein